MKKKEKKHSNPNTSYITSKEDELCDPRREEARTMPPTVKISSHPVQEHSNVQVLDGIIIVIHKDTC